MKYDITGQRFGKLIAISVSAKRNSSNDILWKCKCDCGGEKLTTSGALRHGATKSCGCMMGSPTHGDSSNRIRHTWRNMMSRCYNKNNNRYHIYGAAGISVCKKWHDYSNFKKWAYENGYKDDLTIDRYPNKKGNYTPSNVRWATVKQQSNNRTTNKLLRIGRQIKTVQQWSETYGINQSRILRRIKAGWDIKTAITKPTDKKKIAKRYKKCQ